MFKHFVFKTGICIFLGVSASGFSGCGGTELENKSFPLAVLISEQDGQYKSCYLSQQLSEVANERADGGNMTAESASGSTYYETHKTFEKNNRSQLDTSHTKAVIFQKEFLTGGTLETFLETVRRENTYARNTLVYLSDSSMEKLEKLNSSLEVPLGSYLEQMTENEKEIKEQAAVTLGTLLNEQANASRTLLVPVIQEKRGIPQIHAYEVLQNFKPKGRIGLDEAQIYYLLAGQLSQMDIYLNRKEQLRLINMKCRRNFVMSDGKVTEQIVLTAQAEHVTGTASRSAAERTVKERIERICRAGMEQGIDLSDSARYLPLHAPDVYRVYGRQAERYRENLEFDVLVQIRMISRQ